MIMTISHDSLTIFFLLPGFSRPCYASRWEADDQEWKDDDIYDIYILYMNIEYIIYMIYMLNIVT